MSLKWNEVDLKAKKSLGSQNVNCLLNRNKIFKRKMWVLQNNFFFFLFSSAVLRQIQPLKCRVFLI